MQNHPSDSAQEIEAQHRMRARSDLSTFSLIWFHRLFLLFNLYSVAKINAAVFVCEDRMWNMKLPVEAARYAFSMLCRHVGNEGCNALGIATRRYFAMATLSNACADIDDHDEAE